MHSYGGCPGSAAAAGLSKAARTAAGKQGGIIQEMIITNSKVPWNIQQIAASHSSFLSQPSVVADWIEYEIAIFQSVASNTTNISDLTVGANATSPLLILPAEFDMTLAAVS